MSDRPFAYVWWDGERLADEELPGGRRLGIDARCLAGDPVAGAWASVCACTGDDERIPFDQPEVQGVRRDALGWWIPMLGDALVCLSTFSLDAVHFGGAITVVRDPARLGDDPFARLFPATVVRTGLFSAVDPPAGPVLERYAGAPWPGGTFAPS